MNNIIKLKPFQKFCMTIGNLPSSYVESLTYLELLYWLCNFLEKEVIPVVNNNSDVVKELQTYVANYFDNLDVQEEINIKLDEMAEDGSLGNIINSYITNKMTRTYSTVSQMKADSSLLSGMFAKTKGFHSINDFGSANYYITDSENIETNESNIILLNNGLKAVLLIEKTITPEMCGAYGDEIHDDGTALQVAAEIGNNITFNSKRTYLTSKDIVLNNSGIINLNGSTIKMYNRQTSENCNLFNIKGKGISLINGFLIGDLDLRETYPESVYGIRIGTAENIKIENVKISKFCTDGILITNSTNVSVCNSEINNCGRNNISLLYGKNINLYDLFIHDCEGKKTPGHGIDIEPYENLQNLDNININNIITKNNFGSAINLSCYYNGNTQVKINNIYSEDNFSIKASETSQGYIDINNIFILKGSLTLQDLTSEDLFTNIENVTIKEYRPNVITSFWGSAVKVRNGVNHGTKLYNLKMKNIKIQDGTPTQGIYLSTLEGVENSSIQNIECDIPTIPVILGAHLEGLKIKNIISDFIPTTTSINNNNIAPIIGISGATTISENYPLDDWFEIKNLTNSDLTITGANNFGLSNFILPAHCSCKIKIINGVINIDAPIIKFINTANSEISLNINNTTKIICSRSSYKDIYSVFSDNLIKTFTEGTTNVTISINEGVATCNNSSGGNATIYLLK